MLTFKQSRAALQNTLVLSVLLTLGTGCATVLPPDTALVYACEMKPQFITLHHGTEVETLEPVKGVLATIMISESESKRLSLGTREALLESYELGVEVESAIAAPPRIAYWGLFDAENEPVCLLTFYMGDIFELVGLETVSSGMYQVVESKEWKGTFRSRKLISILLGRNYPSWE